MSRFRWVITLKLNLPRRVKRRLPAGIAQSLDTTERLNETWSADFMADALRSGRCLRTFNVIDDFSREALPMYWGTGSVHLQQHERGVQNA